MRTLTKPSIDRGKSPKYLQWVRDQTPRLRQAIETLIEKDWCRMFEVKGKFIYLLIDHHRYVSFKEAKKVKIGQVDNMKQGFYYQGMIVV